MIFRETTEKHINNPPKKSGKQLRNKPKKKKKPKKQGFTEMSKKCRNTRRGQWGPLVSLIKSVDKIE